MAARLEVAFATLLALQISLRCPTAGLAFGRGALMKRKTAERDREIFAGYKAGRTPEQLAQTFGLAIGTVTGIIGSERHRREVCIDEFYEVLRSSGLQPR
jgi:hypothetical protein